METVNPWDAIAQLYHDFEGESGDALRQFVVDPCLQELLGDYQGLALLDAGCGNGYWSRRLALTAKQVVAMDASATLIGIAAAQVNPGHIRFVQADLSLSLPFADSSFDRILSSLVLQYLPSLDSCLREFARVLKPDGTAVLAWQHPFYEAYFHRPGEASSTGPFVATASYFDRVAIQQKIMRGQATETIYHRTLADYLTSFGAAGFQLQELREPSYPDALLQQMPGYQQVNHIPRLLAVRLVKRQIP